MILDPSKGILQKINYAKILKPIYYGSLVRNSFAFLCENQIIKHEYERIMGGLFAGRIAYLPLVTQYVGTTTSKEEARQRLNLPKSKITLLSFGSFHSGKDLKVIAHALQSLTNVYLLLAGKASYWRIDYIRSIKKEVIVRNYYIPEDEKRLYFSAADAIVLSYFKSFLERKTAGMLWEGCKFGIPIIASDGGQLGKLVKRYELGLLFEPEDALSLRKAIFRFLRLSEDELKRFKRNCKKFSNDFSAEKWSIRCERIYNYISSNNV